MSFDLDSYVVRARLWPALIAAAPPLFVLFSFVPLDWKDWQLVGGCIVFLGLLGIMEHLGRERGYRLQPALFESWGGPPTTRFLRHRDSTLNALTKSRYHKKLAALVPVEDMPTVDSESKDPAAADSRYETCAQYLRARTRKKDDYPLVFAKNVEFGFRRNCLGIRRPAIWLAAVSLLAVTIRAVAAGGSPTSGGTAALLSGIAICLLLIWWTNAVNSEWAKSTADAYAEALLATCEQIERPGGTGSTPG